MNTELLDALAAHTGLVCLVGAGGKKSTLYRLAGLHPGRVGITATVHIAPFPELADARQILSAEADLETAVGKAAAATRMIAFACPPDKPQRLAGVSPLRVAAIHAAAGFDVTFIKADGARGRWIKAPNETEPPLPENADTVIAVVSARAIGEPLSERTAHRIEQITRITGAAPGEPITPEHVARLLADPEGALKNAGNARVVPLINGVDDADREAQARKTAERALELSERFDRVVLSCMTRLDPLIGVIRR